MCEIELLESSELYVICYGTSIGDYNKICTLYKSEVSKQVAEDILEYFRECD